MKLVRNCPAARWLPSRRQLGISRLYAYLRMSRLQPDTGPKGDGHAPHSDDEMFLAIDPGQSAAENYALSIGALAVTTCFAGEAIRWAAGTAAAVLLALPVALAMLQLPLFAVGLVVGRRRSAHRLNSAVLGALLLGAAVQAIAAGGWIGWVGRAVVLFAIVEGVARLVMLPLAARVAAMEERCGAS